MNRSDRASSFRARGSALVLALMLAVAAVVTPGAGGVAAAAEPACGPLVDGSHQVSTATQLAAVGSAGTGTGDCQLGASYRQMGHIDLAGIANWMPIAPDPPYGVYFTGVFDGAGYEIRNLTIARDGEFLYGFGLFGQVGGSAIIRDVHLRAASVSVPNGNLVGALVGALDGTAVVERSSATGTVLSAYDVGGLVGGLAVWAGGGGAVRYSWADVAVTAESTDSSHNSIGGLVGSVAGGGVVLDSYSRGSVTVVAPSSNDDFGGLVGTLGGAGTAVRDSYATGLVSVAGAGQVGRLGGLVSFINSTSAAGAVVEDSFWDLETTGQALSAVTGGARNGDAGRTTAQMTSFATYEDAGWMIVDGSAAFDPAEGRVWGICPSVNGGYPFLLWQFAADICPTAPGTTVSGPAGPTFLLGPGGVVPLAPTGTAVWQQADGTTVPLEVTSPAPGQVRYEVDGVRLTLTGSAGTSASRGLVADAAGEVVCEVCVTLAGGGVIEAWMFSTPRLVAAHLIADLPCQTFTVPVVAPLDGSGPVTPGAHTLQLVLPTASGMQAVNVGVTVGGPVPTSVPAGEGPVVPGGLLAIGLLAAAGSAMVARRRQAVAG